MRQLPELTQEERIPLLLRGMYESYGFRRFRLSRFEPYDLYWQNRNFLLSEQVLTFTGADGRLLAMRPDVTVGIAKNIPAETASAKLYYLENVFRRRPGSREYSEISQIGLESIGRDDVYSEAEVVLLALESLELLGEDYLLGLGHMGLVGAALTDCGLEGESQEAALELLRQKNEGALTQLLTEQGSDADSMGLLLALTRLSGPPDQVLPQLSALPSSPAAIAARQRLEELCLLLAESGYGQRLRLDFSLVCDMDYYNGLVFRGFLRRLPTAVLSGGRYDKLMLRFHKPQAAIGFAIYWGEAARAFRQQEEYEADVLLLYNDGSQARQALAIGEKLRRQGLSVRCETQAPTGLQARQVLTIEEYLDSTAKEDITNA